MWQEEAAARRQAAGEEALKEAVKARQVEAQLAAQVCS
jgi:hypothetical protein